MKFEDFYRSSYERVFAATYLACGSRELANDATQESFQRAFARWSRLSHEPWATGWLITTALNTCKRYAKRMKMERQLVEDPAVAGPESYALDERDLDLLGGIRTLPFRQRQALVLFYLEDIPLPVIADLMSVSEGTVKAHLAQARQALRRELEVKDAG